MGTIIILIIGVIAVGLMMNKLSNPETKLFRRVWSTERMSGQLSGSEQAAAVNSLMQRYGVNLSGNAAAADEATGELLAAAMQFDVTYRNNLGVQVTPVLARELLRRIPEGKHPELSAKLAQTQRLDAVAFGDAMQKTISEMHPSA